MCEQTDPKPEAAALQSLSVPLVVPDGDDSMLTFATTLLKMKNNNGKWHTNNGCAIFFFLLFPFKISTLVPGVHSLEKQQKQSGWLILTSDNNILEAR